MNKLIAFDFWMAYLGLIRRGGADKLMKNPEEEFNRRVHDGEMLEASEAEYFDLKQQAEEVSPLWRGALSEKTSQILIHALEDTNITDYELEKIADILAECSDVTDYDAIQKERVALGSPYHSYPGNSGPVPLPGEIYRWLDREVYKQSEAKKVASLLLYHHLCGRRRVALFMGPTASGKTQIWKTLQARYDFIHIIDGSRLQPEGYRGNNLRDLFEGVDEQTRGHMIIVFDEADKMLETHIGGNGTNYALKIQNQILCMLNGDRMDFGYESSSQKAFSVDCSGISVVLLGSFESLLQKKAEKKAADSPGIGFGAQPGKKARDSYQEVTVDDLVNHGNMRLEIAGRIGSITSLEPMTAEDFYQILKNPLLSPLHEARRVYRMDFPVEEETLRIWAENAEKSRLGCRYLNSAVERFVDNLIFEQPQLFSMQKGVQGAAK